MENYNTFGKNIYEFIQFIKKIMDKTNDDLEKEIGICSRNFSKWKNGVEPEKNTLSAIYDYSKRSIECTKRLENNGIMSFNDFYLALHKTDFYEIITDCIDKEKKDNSFEEKESNNKSTNINNKTSKLQIIFTMLFIILETMIYFQIQYVYGYLNNIIVFLISLIPIIIGGFVYMGVLFLFNFKEISTAFEKAYFNNN